MKTKQNLAGTPRQKSIKSLDTISKSLTKSDKARLVIAPGLMAAIKGRVRPVGAN